LSALCDKLLELIANMGDLSGVAEALATLVAQLTALCDKIEAGFDEMVSCLEDMKDALDLVVEGLAAICEKLDAVNESLTAICDKLEKAVASLDAILAAILAQTVILTDIEANQTGMSCDEPTYVTSCDPQGTIDECCTGGATETTAQCANIPKSWTEGSLGTFDRCTWSFGGISLPDDNYTLADFTALIEGVGGTIEPNPNNPDQYTICVPDGFSTCYQAACFKDRVGQLTRACVIAVPNTTEEVCKNFPRFWSKFEEPIGNTLTTSLAVQEESLIKLCEIAESNAAILEKMCEPCPLEVVDGVAQGDHSGLNGTTQSVYDQYGNEIGSGLVTATYDSATMTTSISVAGQTTASVKSISVRP